MTDLFSPLAEPPRDVVDALERAAAIADEQERACEEIAEQRLAAGDRDGATRWSLMAGTAQVIAREIRTLKGPDERARLEAEARAAALRGRETLMRWATEGGP